MDIRVVIENLIFKIKSLDKQVVVFKVKSKIRNESFSWKPDIHVEKYRIIIQFLKKELYDLQEITAMEEECRKKNYFICWIK